MKRSKFGLAILLLSLFWLTSRCKASLIVADDFSYANGPLSGTNGGTNGNAPTNQWSGAWTAESTISASSGQALLGDTGEAYRPFATSFTGASPLYFSALFTKSGGNAGYALWLRLDNDANENNNIATIGLANDQFSARLLQGNLTEVSGDFGTYTPGSQVLIVGKLEFNASGVNERLKIWVNPTDVETAPIVSGSLLADLGWVTPNHARLRNWVGTGNYRIDDVRIGTTWADVGPASAVPEPSSLVFLAMGMTGLLAAGRRQER